MSAKTTVLTLQKKKQDGQKIVVLTCYDYPTARLLDAAGTDIIFVGDSLGDNVLGYDNTLPVTLDEMTHHCVAVRRGTERALLLADMPFLTYQVGGEEALRNAGHLVKRAGVEAVKLEGGIELAATAQRIVEAGIPVMGHIGFTPQSLHALGGYRVQGRDDASAEELLRDALALQEAGAFALVLEMIPATVAQRITERLRIPTIGIGAGAGCDGQVLVLHDLIGMYPERKLRHVKRFAEVGTMIRQAAEQFAAEVRAGTFPPYD